MERSALSGIFKAPLGRPSLPKRPKHGAKVTAIAEVLEKGSKGPNQGIPAGLNKYSSRITQPKSQGASQAMLYATGLKEGDMNKPQVGALQCRCILHLVQMPFTLADHQLKGAWATCEFIT